MKTLTTFILAGALALLAQPNQLDLRQDPPTAVQSERVSSAYTGTSGATTYYYWVVTRYPIGFIVPTAPVIVGGAAALGGGNSVALGWPAMTGASSYDVLRTTTNAAPSSCTCAVVLATTGTTLTDNGGALSAWPPGGLNSAGVAQAELQINNRDAGAPYITLAVRNAQRILNYQLGILKNGTVPSYVPSGFIQPYANQYGRLACVDSAGADCLNTTIDVLNFGAVCNGSTDDSAAFNAAIQSLAATGGTVIVPRGSCLVSSSVNMNVAAVSLLLEKGAEVKGTADPLINITASNVGLYGAGKGSKFRSTATTPNTVYVGPGVTGITINSVEIVGGGKTADEGNRSVGNAIWVRGTLSGASCTTTSTVDILNSYISNGNNDIYIFCGAGGRVLGNTLSDSIANLAQISLHSSSSFIVSSNNLSTSGSTYNGIYVLHLADNPSSYNSISNNSISGNYTYECINLFGMYNTVTGNAIANTDTISTAAVGIAVTQPSGSDTASRTNNNTITGNVIRMSGSVSPAAILNKDNGSSGNYGSNDNTYSANVIINGSVVVNDYSKRIIVSSNRINGTSTAATDGVAVQGANALYPIVTGNIVSSAIRQGIYVNTGDYAVVTSNVTYSNGQHGVLIDGSSGAVVASNVANSNTQWGIILQNSGSSFMWGNSATGNPGGDLYRDTSSQSAGWGGLAFANLGTPADGTLVYCSDCLKATPCAGAGTGALAVRAAGAWDCNP